MEQEINLSNSEERNESGTSFNDPEIGKNPVSDVSIEKERIFENKQPSLNVPQPQPVNSTNSNTDSINKDDNDDSAADDADVIEKAWVDKAKKIVEETRHDPYQQEKRANALNAVYVKKRYNKDIILGDN